MCENIEKESQEVVLCMREQIEMGAYPGDEIIDETVEILLPVLKRN